MTTAINFKTNPGQLERAHSARYALPKERPTFYRRAGEPKKSNLELPDQVKDLFRVLNTKTDRERAYMREDGLCVVEQETPGFPGIYERPKPGQHTHMRHVR